MRDSGHDWLLTRPLQESYAQRREAFIDYFDINTIQYRDELNHCKQYDDESVQQFANRYLHLIQQSQSTMNDEEIYTHFVLKLSTYYSTIINQQLSERNYDLNKLIYACKAIEIFTTNHDDDDDENTNDVSLPCHIQQINNHSTYTAEVFVENTMINTTLINNNTMTSAISYEYFKSLPKHIRDELTSSYNFCTDSYETIIMNNTPMISIGHIPLTFQIGSYPREGNKCEIPNIEFQVISKLSVDCVIGQDILQQYFDGFNHRENKLYFGSQWNKQYVKMDYLFLTLLFHSLCPSFLLFSYDNH